jgi:hypothetical protein
MVASVEKDYVENVKPVVQALGTKGVDIVQNVDIEELSEGLTKGTKEVAGEAKESLKSWIKSKAQEEE